MHSLRLFFGLVGFCSPFLFCTVWVSSCILPIYRGKPSFYPLFVNDICSGFTNKKKVCEVEHLMSCWLKGC